MAAKTTITCQDCGHSYATIRKNTKYCRVCRLARNLEFLKDTTYECGSCGTAYAPLERQKADWALCINCSPTGAAKWTHDHSGTCALCNADTDKLIHPDIAVCRKCAHDPDKRVVFFKAILRKRRERQAE